MLKKFLTAVLFFSTVFISTNIASAQDVWVYTDTNTGVAVYVDDEYYSNRAGDAGKYSWAKWVSSSGDLLKEQKWYFYYDEGYLHAWRKNKNGKTIESMNIYRGKTYYYEPIEDRPDLLAIYEWIKSH